MAAVLFCEKFDYTGYLLREASFRINKVRDKKRPGYMLRVLRSMTNRQHLPHTAPLHRLKARVGFRAVTKLHAAACPRTVECYLGYVPVICPLP